MTNIKLNKITFKKEYDEGIRPEDIYDPVEPELQRSWELDQWYFQYVYAEADIEINGIDQTIKSGGLGAVPSNAHRDSLEEIKQQVFDELKDILAEIGVNEIAIEDRRSQYMGFVVL